MLAVRNRYVRANLIFETSDVNRLFQTDPTKPSKYPSSAPNFNPDYASSGPHRCPRTMTNARNSNQDLCGATKMRSTVSAARLEEFFNFLSVLSLESQFPLCAQSCTGFFFCFLQNFLHAGGQSTRNKEKKRTA